MRVTTFEIYNNMDDEYEVLIRQAEKLRDEKNIDDALVVCSNAVKFATDNKLPNKEIKARRLLAILYRLTFSINAAWSEYGKVTELANEHGLRYSDEYEEALFDEVMFLTRMQPPPPQMFSLAEELVEIRSKKTEDENDKRLQDYKMFRDQLNRVYKRKHRLRKVRRYKYISIAGVVK